MKFDEIKRLLPQKFPFLMVDRVLSLEKGKKAISIKNITGNEIFLLGHFPNMAVMPGALIIESMAQTAIILFRKSYETDGAVLEDENTLFFLGGAKVRFFKPVVPGDQLQLEVTMTKAVSTGGIVEAIATVSGQRVAKAELSFGVKKLDEFQKA
ncbi:3-hydroxyacyl-ACP dehydratase FabZ [Candidatus Poribacteria bacterium]|nr:3-hydroxyacyl-ACP dehydratase FabZ [Candidatus Poribacteria bacterium]